MEERVEHGSEKCEVKLESVHEVKVEESVKAKESEHSKDLSEKNPTNGSTIVEKQEGKQTLIAKFRM